MKKLSLVVGVLCSAIMLVSSSAYAVEGTFSGRIEILQSLSITEVTALDFGQVNKPSSGSNTFTLAPGNIVTVAGAGDGFSVPGTAAVGEYTVSGQANQNFTASVNIVDFADAGITIVDSHLNGLTNSHSAALDAAGSYDLVLGGVVEVTNAATLGVHTTDVVLTANYE